MSQVVNTPTDLQQVKHAALGLLAMREHSTQELRDKLSRKCSNQQLIADVIDELQQHNLQSDERFTQAFITMRQRQGKGPRLISLELRQRGVAEFLVGNYLDEQDSTWLTSALNLCAKRVKSSDLKDSRQRAKLIRFLQGRGFSGEQIRRSLAQFESGEG